MTDPGAPEPLEAVEARLGDDLDRAVDAARAHADFGADDEAVIRALSRMTDRLRTAMIGMGEVRGAVALRMRDRLNVSFTKLGEMMAVTRARASEIVGDARDKAGIAALPEIALAVVTTPSGVIVAKRADGKPPWTFPGGEQEPGESVEQAAVREVAEETGATVTAGEIIGRRLHPQTKRWMTYVACSLETDPADVRTRDAGELSEVRIVDLTDARLLMPSMFSKLAEYLERTLGNA